jgi:hypothetical protein
LERCFEDLSNGILQAPKFRKFQPVKPKKNFSRSTTVEQAGQKNCNGKTSMFSTSALKESQAFAYYWQCLLVSIVQMVNLMIIYIKKIIVKALDFNDIINFLWGC